MAEQILSGKYFLLTVFFLVFSFFISVNSYGGVSMPTNFLSECESGLSANGCCVTNGLTCDIPNIVENNNGCTCDNLQASGEVFVENRILYIFGTSGVDDVQVSDDNPNLKLQNVFNGVSQVDVFIPKSNIDSVVVIVCDGNDSVQMGSITFPTLIEGGAGEDQLQGGDGPDTIYGGPDDDEIQGNDGNDDLFGGDPIDGDCGDNDQVQQGDGSGIVDCDGPNSSGSVNCCNENDDNGCSTKVDVCHSSNSININTVALAGSTSGSHFTRCDWVPSGQGTDASNATCDIACVSGGIDVDCSEFRNLAGTGHSADLLGECSEEGCTENEECDDGNICTENVCNDETGECSFPIEEGEIVCRPTTGDCDPEEVCGNVVIDICPSDMFEDVGTPCTDSGDDPIECETQVCNDNGMCIINSTGCECSSDTECNDGNSCTEDSCNDSTNMCDNINLVDGTICRSANGVCDEAEECASGLCPEDSFVPAEEMVVCDNDGDDCTNQFCDGIGGCELIILEPGEGECSGPRASGDPSTDNGEAFQLYCYYDLRERDSFCQVTNIGPDNITLHVQVFNVGNNCIENNFNDTYTPSDTHVYELSNILTNDGSPSGIVLPDDAYGFVVVTVVGGGGQEAVEGKLIGNFRVIDNSGYEYRSNALGLDLPSSEPPIETSNEYTFNFNEEGGVVLSDVVGITLDEITGNEVKATSIVDIFTKFDVTVFNNDEVIFSCRDIVFACNDQDAPLLSSLLDVSSSSVASFEYGINNAFPHSRGGPLLCPGNNITEGFVRLNLIPPFSDFDVIAGYVGLNNGNGRGSMDTFWSENFLLQPPPP